MADMMFVKDYFYVADLTFGSSPRTYRMIEIPYEGDRFVMQILMPYNDQLLEDLSKAGDLVTLFNQQKEEVERRVSLPRFKLSDSSNLIEPLKRAGMRDMITRGE